MSGLAFFREGSGPVFRMRFIMLKLRVFKHVRFFSSTRSIACISNRKAGSGHDVGASKI